MSTIIWSRRVKVRKAHQCQACGEVIEVGTTVAATCNADEGTLATSYWCDVCVRFMTSELGIGNCEDGFSYDIWDFDGYREFRAAELPQEKS